jgi:4-carboxymuconolactone decarboxylase
MDERLFELGLQKRRKVLGDEYVERWMARVDGFNREFHRFMTEYCWGWGVGWDCAR